MPRLLLIESSNQICSVALYMQGEIIQEKFVEEPNSHSVHLASFVYEVMALSGLSFNQLDGVVVSDGPGSYTGLRIGSSLAKGVCFGADIPLIAVSTLRGLAGIALKEYPSVNQVISLVDARRSNAYMGIYDYQLNPLVDEHFVAINSEIRIEKNNTAIIGSGAIKFIDELDKDKELKHSKSALYAKDLLWEALQKWARNDYVDLTSYEPNYIKSVFVTKPKSKF